jgi:hypothetical protein
MGRWVMHVKFWICKSSWKKQQKLIINMFLYLLNTFNYIYNLIVYTKISCTVLK